MGRPKKCAKEGALDLGRASELCQCIEAEGSLPACTVLELLHADAPPCAPPCSKSQHSRRDNPSCFCNMVPQPGGFKKKGIWQKNAGLLAKLGGDPTGEARPDPATPAGLRNLGNTCYVNTALQCMFSVPAFRAALLRATAGKLVLPAQDAVTNGGGGGGGSGGGGGGGGGGDGVTWEVDEVADELGRLFLELQFGPCAYADPTPFVKCLQLDHAVQQDCQEFFKLLLTKLESVFACVPDQDVSHVVQQLFRGTYSYVTTCGSCGRHSASSDKKSDFYELQLQVKGFRSLHDSLTSSLECEHLDGSNQYFCEFCETKVNATRQMALRTMPPYLCLQLQRFVFDYQRMDKLKVSDKFEFPLDLDAAMVLASVTQDNTGGGHVVVGADGAPVAGYELAGVLIHKGSNAHHGHYVAHVRDTTTGKWWRFDDEAAQSMGAAPTGFPSDHGVAVLGGDKGGGASGSGSGGKKRGRPPGAVAVGAKKKAAAAGGKKGGGGGAKKDTKGEVDVWVVESDDDDGGGGAGGGYDDDDVVEMLDEAPAPAKGRGRPAKSAAAAKKAKSEDQDWEEDAEVEEKVPAKKVGRTPNRKAASKKTGSDDEDWEAAEAEEKVPVKKGGRAPTKRAAPKKADSEDEDWEEGAEAEEKAPAPKKGGRAPNKKRASKKAESDDDDWEEEEEGEEGPGKRVAAGEVATEAAPEGTCVTSSNAYMLLYRQRGFSEPPSLAATAQLPPAAASHVAEMAAAWAERNSTYLARRAEVLSSVEARRVSIREVLSVAPLPADSVEAEEGGGRWVSAAWLEEWASAEGDPKPIANAQLLCRHAKLDPGRVKDVKRVSEAAWKALVGAHGGGPELCTTDFCTLCIKSDLQKRILAEQADNVRRTLGELLAADNVAAEPAPAPVGGKRGGGGMAAGAGGAKRPGRLPGGKRHALSDDEDDGEAAALSNAMKASLVGEDGFLVSKTWLLGWLKRTGKSISLSASPTSAIACPHGALLPAALSGIGSRRIAVASRDWSFLRALYESEADAVAAKAAAAAVDAADKAEEAVAAEAARKIGAEADAAEVAAAAAAAAAADAAAAAFGSAGDDVMIVEEVEGNGAAGPSAPAAAATASARAPAPAQQVPPPPPCIAFPLASARECPLCEAELRGAAADAETVRRGLDAERSALGDLAAGVPREALEPGVAYYGVPRAWLHAWRRHVASGAKSKATAAAAAVAASAAAAAAGAAAGPSGSGAGPSAGSSAPVGPPRPGPLPLALAQLLCDCHPANPGLRVRPPSLVVKRGRIYVDPEEESEMDMISLRDFRALMSFYGDCADFVPEAARKGIELFVDLPDGAPAAATDDGTGPGTSPARGGSGRRRRTLVHASVPDDVGAHSDNDSDEALNDFGAEGGGGDADMIDLSSNEAAVSAAVSAAAAAAAAAVTPTPTPTTAAAAAAAAAAVVPSLMCVPAPCEQHLSAVYEEARVAQLTYDGVEVMVEVITAPDLTNAWAAAPGTERKSRRARKGRVPLTVASTLTLAELKLRIFEALDVHPGNARVYARLGRLLEGEKCTLAQLEVFPDEEIKVIDAGLVDSSDLSFLGSGAAAAAAVRSGRRAAETGFKNTALTGRGPGGGGAGGGGGGGAGAGKGDGAGGSSE
ncbi:hypothetical protein FOA52_013422 [Chlamydomonas sp. UWO 241]|nr:hypothetical protein FOA52_013422 [Chlamydomonas sp. UWO 241]